MGVFVRWLFECDLFNNTEETAILVSVQSHVMVTK
jgi:hypothetical protein